MRRLQRHMVKVTHDLSRRAKAESGEGLDLIIWPESALSDLMFSEDKESHRVLTEWSRELEAPIFFGASHFLGEVGGLLSACNSAFLVEPETGLSGKIYDKIRLVPFGEHLPYFDKIPFLRTLVGIGDFQEGTESTIFGAANRRTHRPSSFGALICFESAFPDLTRRSVNNGAQWMVVITNDAWYGLSKGPAHHQILSIFRAVESRRWVARCANTGISCIVSPNGRVTGQLELDQGDALVGEVIPRTALSPYMRFGELFALLCSLIAVGGLWIAARMDRPDRLQPSREHDDV